MTSVTQRTLPRKPSWFNFFARLNWERSTIEAQRIANDTERAQRIEWFRNLTDSDVTTIFVAFMKFYHDGLAETSQYPMQAKNKVELSRTYIKNAHAAVLESSRNVSDEDSLELYEDLNKTFFDIHSRFIHSDMLDVGSLQAWSRLVISRSAAMPKLQKHLAVSMGAAGVADSNKFDYKSVLTSGILPANVKEQLVRVHRDAVSKMQWNLDGQTRHNILSITSEYLPEMVKSFVELYKAQDNDGLYAVENSILKQLSFLQSYLDGVDNQFVSDAVYAMNVQERFLQDKFGTNRLSLEK